MKYVTYGLCDKCGKEMKSPTDGLIFHGNVYVYSSDVGRGGLIGNNFPMHMDDKEELMSMDDIRETGLCNTCSIEALFGHIPGVAEELNKVITNITKNSKPLDSEFADVLHASSDILYER